MDQLIRILGYTGPQLETKIVNYSKHENYLSYYTNKQTINYVSKMYKKDIQRFGYTFL
jgi:hypothetical protein